MNHYTERTAYGFMNYYTCCLQQDMRSSRPPLRELSQQNMRKCMMRYRPLSLFAKHAIPSIKGMESHLSISCGIVAVLLTSLKFPE